MLVVGWIFGIGLFLDYFELYDFVFVIYFVEYLDVYEDVCNCYGFVWYMFILCYGCVIIFCYDRVFKKWIFVVVVKMCVVYIMVVFDNLEFFENGCLW